MFIIIFPLIDPTTVRVPAHEADFMPWGYLAILILIAGMFVLEFYNKKMRSKK